MAGFLAKVSGLPSSEWWPSRAAHDKIRGMATHALTINYSDDLLLSLKESPEEFAAQARLLLAVKLYELGKISTGRAAELAGMSRVDFLFALGPFGLSPIGVDASELAQDLANARQ